MREDSTERSQACHVTHESNQSDKDEDSRENLDPEITGGHIDKYGNRTYKLSRATDSAVHARSHAGFRLLKPYADTLDGDQRRIVRQQLDTALRAFPSISAYTVSVGRVPPEVEMRGDPVARAHPYNHLIELPVGHPPRNMTVFHEIAHLAIYCRFEDGDDVPRTSERYTSLYALARMDPGLILSDRVPYFGEPDAPADEWPAIARAALAYREEHGPRSHYLQRAREGFAEGVRADE